MKYNLAIYLLISSLIDVFAQANELAFQPFNTQGDNLIHIETADFDGIGAKDYVVAMTVNGKVIAFQRPDLIKDPAADNRLWEYSALPSMGIRIFTGDVFDDPEGDEVILPGTDGHLRILSSSGDLLMDKALSTGALYSADIAVDGNGQTIIATAGVDGFIYFLNTMGEQLAKLAPKTHKSNAAAGVVRHIVAGDFNGDGADEIMSFVNNRSFRGNCFFDITDLGTYKRPSYWNGITSANEDDVALGLGFTDKQLPRVYDMDADGNDEVVGHWGVFHPEDGPRTQLFSTMLAEDEKLPLSRYKTYAQDYLIQNHGFRKSDKEDLTNTTKYLLQNGVPGDFDKDGKAELFTIYGDDLFLSQYDPALKSLAISDYTWAHSMYHFSDGSCLQDRNGGADKMVLAGPINGDDHFYVVDVSDSQWKTDARNICCSGIFAKVETNLDGLANGINQFSGTVAEGNEPIWYVDYFASWLGWEMNPENIESRAQGIYDAEQTWYDKIGGQSNYHSSRIRIAASINSTVYGMSNQCTKPNITAEGMVELCGVLAKKGAHFCLIIGHGPHLYMSPENLADCYEASVINGKCYMMARTKELLRPEYFDAYKPHLDAILARAAAMEEAPPMVMLCAKGAIFSSMPQQQGEAYFPKYKDVLVPGVENSNVTVPEWSLAERVGLWMNGDVKRWGCNVIGDNLAANRVAEWGGMRNAHVVLRQLLSQYALGARVFRITSITNLNNPMYIRGDVKEDNLQWSQPFQKGVLNFLRIVEKGIYPYSPEVSQVKGISPVSVALFDGSERLKEQSFNHDFYKYTPVNEKYVFNQMACWNAYTDIPETDITSFLYGTKRRWDNLFPSTPGGFVSIVPHKTSAQIESKAWCNRSFQTNGDTWAAYSLNEAKDVIDNEVMAQRENLDFYLEGECFWQITLQKDDPYTYFVLIMGNSVLSPVECMAKLKAGNNIKDDYQVFDQLNGSAIEPLGTISNTSDELSITIPLGVPRFLCIKLRELPNGVEGFEKDLLQTINVYPNPAHNEINIELKDYSDKDVPVTIYDCIGRVVKHQLLENRKQIIDISSWTPGIYVLYVKGNSKNEIIKVLVHSR